VGEAAMEIDERKKLDGYCCISNEDDERNQVN